MKKLKLRKSRLATVEQNEIVYIRYRYWMRFKSEMTAESNYAKNENVITLLILDVVARPLRIN